MTARSGYTLIESTVAITMIGAVLGSVALSLHATRQANRRVRDEVASELELGRFTAQLRSDAHQAQSARLDSGKTPHSPLPHAGEGSGKTGSEASGSASKEAGAAPLVLSLALADGRIARYTLQAQGIEREQCMDRELVRGATVLHRETYRLPAGLTGRWLVRTGSRSPVVSFVLEPVAGRSGRSADVGAYRVDAAVHLFAVEARKSAAAEPQKSSAAESRKPSAAESQKTKP
jgi:type II secretory pathway component PulJ